MVPRLLIPTGRWKVEAEATDNHANIRLTGRAYADPSKLEQSVHTLVLTHDQTQQLISSLNAALREMELQRNNALFQARAAR
jgi:hypothetical protein